MVGSSLWKQTGATRPEGRAPACVRLKGSEPARGERTPAPIFGRYRRGAQKVAPERFTVSRKRRTALSPCFHAIPDGKPLHTFPGIALLVFSQFRTGLRR